MLSFFNWWVFLRWPARATTAVVAFRLFAAPESIGAIMAEGAVVALVYLGAVFAFGLDDAVRTRYVEYVWRAAAALPVRRVRTAQA